MSTIHILLFWAAIHLALQVAPIRETVPNWSELRAAATAGDAESQFQTGMAFYEGSNELQDFKTGVSWFRKAALQGHAKAQYALGSAYASGRGLNVDSFEAYVWIRISAGPTPDETARAVLSKVARTLSSAQIQRAETTATNRRKKIKKRRLNVSKR